MKLEGVGLFLMTMLLVYSVLLFWGSEYWDTLQDRSLVIINLDAGFLVGRKFVNPFLLGCLAGFPSL